MEAEANVTATSGVQEKPPWEPAEPDESYRNELVEQKYIDTERQETLLKAELDNKIDIGVKSTNDWGEDLEDKHETDGSKGLEDGKKRGRSLQTRGRAVKATVSRRNRKSTLSTAADIPLSKSDPMEVADGDDQGLFCICRKPDNGQWMIACDGCDEWFHGACVGVDEKLEKLLEIYFCDHCSRAGKGQTLWKRKCRLQECCEPADIGLTFVSQYCCSAHGVEYFSRKIKQGRLAIEPGVLLKLISSSEGSSERFKAMGAKCTPALSLTAAPLLPEEMAMCEELGKERKYLLARMDFLEKQKQLLLACKERARILSDEIKQAGGHKKDTCGYDTIFNIAESSLQGLMSDSDTAQNLLDSRISAPAERICLSERRKCFKHNGWQSILADEIQQASAQVSSHLERLDVRESYIESSRMRRHILRIDKDSGILPAAVSNGDFDTNMTCA